MMHWTLGCERPRCNVTLGDLSPHCLEEIDHSLIDIIITMECTSSLNFELGTIKSQAPTPLFILIGFQEGLGQMISHTVTTPLECIWLKFLWNMLWCLDFPTLSICDWNLLKGKGRGAFNRSESWIEITCRPGKHIKHQSVSSLLHSHTVCIELMMCVGWKTVTWTESLMWL